MKKVKNKLSSSKKMMMLSVMHSLSKAYDTIANNVQFSISSEKNNMSNSDITITKSIVINFFEAIGELEIAATDITILSFFDKICDLLIEDSAGNDKIRGYQAIKDEVKNELKLVNRNVSDDSHKLINELI